MIEAIKVVRQERNLGLKEAKDAVDAYLKTKNGDGASRAEAGLCPLACCSCDSSSPRCLLVLDTRGLVGRNNPGGQVLLWSSSARSFSLAFPARKTARG